MQVLEGQGKSISKAWDQIIGGIPSDFINDPLNEQPIKLTLDGIFGKSKVVVNKEFFDDYSLRFKAALNPDSQGTNPPKKDFLYTIEYGSRNPNRRATKWIRDNIAEKMILAALLPQDFINAVYKKGRGDILAFGDVPNVMKRMGIEKKKFNAYEIARLLAYSNFFLNGFSAFWLEALPNGVSIEIYERNAMNSNFYRDYFAQGEYKNQPMLLIVNRTT